MRRLKEKIGFLLFALALAAPAAAHVPPVELSPAIDLRHAETTAQERVQSFWIVTNATAFDEVAHLELPAPSIADELAHRFAAGDVASRSDLAIFDRGVSRKLASGSLGVFEADNVNAPRELRLELRRTLGTVRNRWYDPQTGTFLSPDPLGYRDSSNLYAFVGGDPVNRRDPTGEGWFDDAVTVAKDFATDSLQRASELVAPILKILPFKPLIARTEGSSQREAWREYAGDVKETFVAKPCEDRRDSCVFPQRAAPAERPEPNPVPFVEEGIAAAEEWPYQTSRERRRTVARGVTNVAAVTLPLMAGGRNPVVIEQAESGVVTGSSRLGLFRNTSRTSSILNIGSGRNPMPGAVNMETLGGFSPGSGVNVIGDATALPFRNGAFAGVHAVNPYGYQPVTAEIARVLQPGTNLFVSGQPWNTWAVELAEAEAAAAGFGTPRTLPIIPEHMFGVQRTTTGHAITPTKSTTTIYPRQ